MLYSLIVIKDRCSIHMASVFTLPCRISVEISHKLSHIESFIENIMFMGY